MKKSQKRFAKPGLQFEQLECRLPLAGNVAAALSASGDLTIKGDNLENDISVFIQAGEGGAELVVQGNDTRVNNQSEVAFNLDDLGENGIRNVSINMGRAHVRLFEGLFLRGPFGADRVSLEGLEISGNLTVNGTHAGVVTVQDASIEGTTNIGFGFGISSSADGFVGSRISLDGSTFGVDVTINTGASPDQVTVFGTDVGRDLVVNTGLLFDSVTIGSENTGNEEEPEFGPQSSVGRNLRVNASQGIDQIELLGLDVTGTTTLDAGAGSDRVSITDGDGITTSFQGAVTVNLGGGLVDRAEIRGSSTIDFGGDLTVNGGNAIDLVGLFGIGVAGALRVTAGGGIDHLDLANLDVTGTTTLDAGAGLDDVTIGNQDGDLTTFQGDVTVKLGGGLHDEVAILGVLEQPAAAGVSSTTFANLTINGGSGRDCVALLGVAVAENLRVDTGSGNDFVGADELSVAGDVTVTTGAGNDIVTLGVIPDPNNDDATRNFIGGATTIDVGAGNDIVAAQNATFNGAVNITAGAGNDTVAVRHSIFLDAVFADGGTGINRGLFDDDNLFLGGDPVVNNLPEPADFDAAIEAMLIEIFRVGHRCFPDLIAESPLGGSEGT